MAKGPKDPKEIFAEFISDYKNAFADDLVGIALYGSAAGGDYRPGKSDINFMIVLSENGIENLDRTLNIVKKWRKRGVAIPIFLTERYVETSLDVFPIEYLNFQKEHVLVYGKDIFEDLTFDRKFLRLQCEREIKGKLLLLREAFLEAEGKGRALKEVIRQSLPAFIAVFEALLYLKGKELPKERKEIVGVTCEAFGLESQVFQRLLDLKSGRIRPVDSEVKKWFKDYLQEIFKLSRVVDQLGGSHE